MISHTLSLGSNTHPSSRRFLILLRYTLTCFQHSTVNELTLFAVSPTVSICTLTDVIKPVIHAFSSILTRPQGTLAKPWAALSDASGLCSASRVQFLAVDEHIPHTTKKIVCLNVLSRVIKRTIEVLYPANKQRRVRQVEFPAHENKGVH